MTAPIGTTRPSRRSPDVQRPACGEILHDVLTWLQPDRAEPEEVLEDLVKAADEDAYQFARNLEHRGWYPDANLVEVLGGYDTWRVHDRAVKDWVFRHGIVSPFNVGDLVRWRGRELRVNELRPLTAEIVAQPVEPTDAEVLSHRHAQSWGYIIAVEDVQMAEGADA